MRNEMMRMKMKWSVDNEWVKFMYRWIYAGTDEQTLSATLRFLFVKKECVIPLLVKIPKRLGITVLGINILGYIFLGIALTFPLTLPAKKSHVMRLTATELGQGTLEKIFLDTNNALMLTPEYTKRTEVAADIVWDAVSWDHSQSRGDQLWLGGGTNGFLTALDTNLKTLFETNLPYPEVTALAAAVVPERLFIANGPNGALYQLTPREPTETDTDPYLFSKLATFTEPFIWDLYFHADMQTLYVATGGARHGAVYQLILTNTSANIKKLEPIKLFSVSEANALKLAYYQNNLLVSSSPHGKLYSYQLAQKTLNVLYDSFQGDIADFVLAPEINKLYLATTSLIRSNQLAQTPPKLNSPCPSSQAASSKRNNVRVPVACSDTNALYVLSLYEDPKQGQLESIIRKLHTLEQGTVTKLMVRDNPKRLVYGSIENSTIRSLNLQTLESKLLHQRKDVSLAQMVYFAAEVYFISLETSALYKLSSAYSTTGLFTSRVIPLKETVQWGRFVFDHYSTAREVHVETRTGDIQTVTSKRSVQGSEDSTLTATQSVGEEASNHWSAWQPLTKNQKIASPPGMFMQFRITLKPTGNTSPQIQNIHFYFTAFNTAPELSPIKIEYKPSENYPPQRSPQSRQTPPPNPLDFLNELGKYTRQYILSWKVLKNDADIVRYALAMRLHNANDSEWKVLAKDFFTNFFLIDNRKFPDGRYQFKLTYDDFLSNGREQGFVREKLSPYHIIDNTPPSITDLNRENDRLTFTIRDNLSIISRVLYSFDRNHHYEISPQDGVNDSKVETFALPLPNSTEANQLTTILIIALDGAGNIVFAYP